MRLLVTQNPIRNHWLKTRKVITIIIIMKMIHLLNKDKMEYVIYEFRTLRF